MLLNTLLWLFLHHKSIVLNVFADQIGLRIRHNNYGDDLNYFLIKFLTGKHIFIYNSFFHPKLKNYVCIGSIVEDLSDEKSIVWGGGVMNDNYQNFIKPLTVTATRGPLTREYLKKHGVESPPIYGDPALLTPMVYTPKKNKNIKLGIIPHFLEINNPIICSFVKDNPDVELIDLSHYKKWTDVIDKICQCQIIASSSLHGLILADSYRIPNVWMCLNKNTGGGEFKYKDYYMGVNKEFVRYNVEGSIDLQVIKDYCDKYKYITFDSAELLKACPFEIVNLSQNV